LASIGDSRAGATRTRRALLVESAGQAGESLFLKKAEDGGRAEIVSLVVEELADIVDREILLAKSNDLLALAVLLGSGLGSFGGWEEECSLGILTEFMDENPKATGGVAEAACRLGGRKSLDEKGAEGFVLAVRRVGRLEEAGGRVC